MYKGRVTKRMFADFEVYWRWLAASINEAARPSSLQGQCAIPKRLQFSPVSLPDLLPHLYMLEHTAGEAWQPRLVGEALSGRGAGAGASGPTVAFAAVNQLGLIAEMQKHVCEQPCGALLRVDGVFLDGAKWSVTCKFLPLAANDGAHKYIVGLAKIEPLQGSATHHSKLLTVMPQNENGLQSAELVDCYYFDVGFGAPA
ncbi:MAG: PAS domain-containing protein [Kordiimonadaceae bacterium]|nr:PAS domain-containing protein [Kordiimonadaceae bacterium]